MKTFIHYYWQKWDEFWFAPQSMYPVSLMRALLGLSMLWMYLIRFFNFEWFFSEKGILPLAQVSIFMPTGYQSLISVYFQNDPIAWWAHLAFCFLLLAFTLGLVGRVGTFALFILHIGFLQRNYSIIYGADLFNTFWLLYLSLVKHNIYFSILNYLPGSRDKNSSGDLLSSVGIRFIQIQLCLTYAYTGIEKLKGQQWWDGTAVWSVLGMKELLAADYTFLQHYPLVIGALTISTVVFEVYFPAAMLYKPLRKYWLAIGLIFHLSTAVFMNLPFFCAVMVAPYILFLSEAEIKNSYKWLQKKWA